MSNPVWKGELQFAGVRIPVSLAAGPRSESISFNQIHARDNGRLKQSLHCIACDARVPRAEIVKGIETVSGVLTFSDDELAALADPRDHGIVHLFFLDRASQPDPLFYESAYYIQPATAEAEPDYAALRECLLKTRAQGIGMIVISKRDRYVIVRPSPLGLIAHTLFYAAEAKLLRDFRCQTATVAGVRKITRLVQETLATFDPAATVDKPRQALESLIAKKLEALIAEKRAADAAQSKPPVSATSRIRPKASAKSS